VNPTPSDLEKAYGLLWAALGDDPRINEARQILSGHITEDGKDRGKDYGSSRHPGFDSPEGKSRPLLGMTALIACDDDEKSDEVRISMLGLGCRVRRARTESDFRRHLAVYTPTMVIGQESG
jgi:hypothetical protein